MVENPNSIFIIEVAEELIKSREGKNDCCISMFLNLNDGMLGDSLGNQVICTFNTSVKNINKALLRKGRLSATYEFGLLCEQKAGCLLKNLGKFQKELTSEMILADIYNLTDLLTSPNLNTKKPIGFLNLISS